MRPHDLVLGLVVGSVALVFGLVPGLFDALAQGVRSFRNSLLFGAPAASSRVRYIRNPGRPLWLAAAGALFMLFTLIAYLGN